MSMPLSKKSKYIWSKKYWGIINNMPARDSTTNYDMIDINFFLSISSGCSENKINYYKLMFHPELTPEIISANPDNPWKMYMNTYTYNKNCTVATLLLAHP